MHGFFRQVARLLVIVAACFRRVGRLLVIVAACFSMLLAPQATAEAGTPMSTWDRLANCESGGNWSINTGNGYYGGLQFSLKTWKGFGGKGKPHKASKAEQIRIAKRVLEVQGWRAWPACSKKLGLR
jgi:hypothetical protein